MKAYKLTNQHGKTRNQTQWGPNVSHTATGSSKELCSDGWIHFYTNSLLAVFVNPMHVHFPEPKLWECETSGEELHEPLKSGCKTLTTIREIPLPEVSPTQKIAFAILCAKEVCKDEKWNLWADRWLSGEDRSKLSASAISIRSINEFVVTGGVVNAAANAAAYSAAVNSKIDFVKMAEKAMTYK